MPVSAVRPPKEQDEVERVEVEAVEVEVEKTGCLGASIMTPDQNLGDARSKQQTLHSQLIGY